jgi:hypothetical protein
MLVSVVAYKFIKALLAQINVFITMQPLFLKY